MDYSFDYSYAMDDEMAAVIGMFYVIYVLFAICFGLVSYVLRSAGTCAIAKRRGIANPWLAWIPVVGVWVLGSISDQYRYVVRGQVKSKRKILLILNIIFAVLTAVFSGVLLGSFVELVEDAMFAGEEAVIASLLGMLLGMLGMSLLMLGVAIAKAVVSYMALYDLYTAANPGTSVVFTVLSIIPFTSVAEPFFVFFSRKKDLGMPPRNDVPVEPIDPPLIREPWENPEA